MSTERPELYRFRYHYTGDIEFISHPTMTEVAEAISEYQRKTDKPPDHIYLPEMEYLYGIPVRYKK